MSPVVIRGVIRGQSVLLGKAVRVWRASRPDDLGVGTILHHDQKDMVEGGHDRRGGWSGGLAGDAASGHKDHGEPGERGPQPSSALFRAWEQDALNDAQDPVGHLAGETHFGPASIDDRRQRKRVRGRNPH